MNIQCSREELSKATGNVIRAVSPKSALPALEGILFSARDSRLYLSAYDMEIGIDTSFPAQVRQPGEVILNARLFSDIVRRLPDENVTISTDDKLMTLIKSGESEYSLIGIHPAEFPELPKITDATALKIDGAVLRSMIFQTAFSVATSDARPVFTGILTEITKEHIRMIAVDGYRLAIRTEPVGNDCEMSFIVPGKTMTEIAKLIEENETDVKIEVAKRHIIFRTGDYNIVSRLIEGEFLDYRNSIPAEATSTVRVDTRGFIDAIERISLLISERVKTPLRCVFADNAVKLSCATAVGKANDRINAVTQGLWVEIGFNFKYLLDALKAAECAEVLLELAGPLSPLKIKPPEGDSFLFLVLPMRLKSES